MLMIQRQQQPENPDCTKKMMTINEAATYCGVCRRIFSRWISKEGLPVHRLPGSGGEPMKRIDRYELDDWLDKFCTVINLQNEKPKTWKLSQRRFFPKKNDRKN